MGLFVAALLVAIPFVYGASAVHRAKDRKLRRDANRAILGLPPRETWPVKSPDRPVGSAHARLAAPPAAGAGGPPMNERRTYLEERPGRPLTPRERFVLWAARGRTRPRHLAEWLFAGLVLVNLVAAVGS